MSKYLDTAKPFPYTQGWGGARTLRKTVPYEPGTVCGFLTAFKQSAGHSVYTIFVCRCGAQVTRRHADVRETVTSGGVPSCPACRAAAMKVAAEQRKAAGK